MTSAHPKTMPTRPTPPLTDLLKHMDRVRAAARSLVQDAASADDLVQDALLAAVQRDPRIEGNALAWTKVTLRNLAWNNARSRGARRSREREAAQPEALPSAVEGAARAELCSHVSDAVLSLDEPYRTVILLRFFEDLPPRKIAARTGATVEAVKKQLTRGQRELQSRLESKYGDRGAWAVALLPLTGRKVLESAKVAGGIGLGLRAAILALSLGTGAVWIANPSVPAELDPAAPARAVETARLAEPPLERAASPQPAAQAASQPTPDPMEAIGVAGSSDSAAASPDESIFRGRAVDVRGQPIAGLQIGWLDEGKRNLQVHGLTTTFQSLPERLWRRETVETDHDGAFQIERYPAPNEGNISWSFPESDLVRSMYGQDTSGVEVFVMATAIRVAGTVVDTESRPLEGVKVSLDNSLGRVEGFPDELVSLTYPWVLYATTDRAGRFDFGQIGGHPSAQVGATQRGEQALVSVPNGGSESLILTLPAGLERPEPPGWSMHGVVFTEDGTPVDDAIVACGSLQTRSNAEGRFEFQGQGDYREGQKLVAQRADFRFTTVAAPAPAAVRAPGGAGPIELRLPPDSLRLHGRLVDSSGEPLSGWHVYALDGSG